VKQKESAGLAIIYRGMVLLAHTTGRKWWGSYGIPKGGIEPGESRMDAAIRETREEVGLDIPRSMIDPNPRTYVLTSRKYKYTKTVYWYVVEVDDLEQIGMKSLVVPKGQLQLEEVDWAGFMPLAEAKKRAMSSQQQLLTQLVGLGLLESHSSEEIYKPEQQKIPNTMKHVKLFEQFINEADQYGGIEVPVAKPKRHKIYKKGDVLIKTDNELQGMRLIDKDRGAKKSTIVKMTDAQKGDTFKITKVEKMKYFHGKEYTGVLTINSGPSAGETLDVMTSSDRFENWKLIK